MVLDLGVALIRCGSHHVVSLSFEARDGRGEKKVGRMADALLQISPASVSPPVSKGLDSMFGTLLFCLAQRDVRISGTPRSVASYSVLKPSAKSLRENI